VKIKLLIIQENIYTERFSKNIYEEIIPSSEHLRKIRDSYKSMDLEIDPDNELT
tara:strand:+ start:237 stop:398 length:162 start_codon:yes stop_codon:yes gene_type:complete